MSFIYCPSGSLIPSALVTFPLPMISTPLVFIPNYIPMSSLNICTSVPGSLFGSYFWQINSGHPETTSDSI